MTPAEQTRILAARRARFSQLKQITPQQAQNLRALARENPSLSVGALYGAGVGGVQPGSPAAQKLYEVDQEVKKSKGNIFQRAISFAYKGVRMAGSAVLPDVVGDTAKAAAPAIKGFTRGAEMGLSAIPQFGQGLVRAGRANDGDFGFDDLTNRDVLHSAAMQTDMRQAHEHIQQRGGYGGLFSGDVDPNKSGTQRATDVDFGSGFFVGGEVARSAGAFKQASTTERIGGKLPTVGRLLANEIGLEPGGTAYNITSGLADLTVALGLDPTSWVGSAPAKGIAAAKSFSGDASKRFDAEKVASKIDERLVDAVTRRSTARGESVEGVAREQMLARIGAVDGIRKTVASDRVLEWLTAKREGRQVVEYLAGETDFAKVYDAVGDKIDPQTLLQLTERKMTSDEIIAILGPKLGRTAITADKFGIDAVAKADSGQGGLGTLATAQFKRKARDVRAFNRMPERVLRKDDLSETLRNANEFMKTALVKDDDVVTKGGRTISRSTVLRRFAEVNGEEGMLEVAEDMMVLGAKKAMDDFGISQDRASELFRLYKETTSEARKYWQERVVVNGEVAWVNRAFNAGATSKLDDEATRALPHLASQFLDNNIPLPDPRAIRAEMSRFRNVLSLPGIQPSKMALQWMQDQIFKPAVLLRPAFVLRNQIDEQFRPAGVGLNSLFSHPVQYMQWLLDDAEGMGRMLNKATAGRFQSRGKTYGVDEGVTEFDDIGASARVAREAYKEAQRSGDARAVARTKKEYEAAKAASKEKLQSITPYTDGVSEYVRALTGGAGNWRKSSYAQMNGNDLFQFSDSSYSTALGEGLHRIFTDPLAKRIAAGEDIEQIKDWWWRGGGTGFRTSLAKNGDRMAYLNDEIGAAQYVDDTVEFIRTFTGDSPELMRAAATGRIGNATLTRGDTLNISDEALEQLDALKGIEGFQGPKAVIGARVIRGGGDEMGKYDQAVNWAFYQLADRPVRYLSRSPAFRERYYKRMEDLIGFMDDGAAAKAIRQAQTANLRGKDIKRLQSKRRPGGNMGFEEAMQVAKLDALQFTNDLFYTLHHRSQFFDAARLIFPFGEVFLDSAKKYSQIVKNNPVLPYRLMQVIEGGRNADINGDGKGFFYTDTQTGEEMFGFPGSQALLGLLGQQGAGQMRAPVQNLNIMGTSVIPGFGPAVQIAAASILPDEADFNAVQKFISPYGEKTLEGGALEAFAPAWFNKFRTAELVPFLDASPAQQRSFTQATKDWMGYLASTGEYNLQDPAGQQKLMDDAKAKARTTFFIRGMAQAFAPSPPSPEFVAYDKDGKLQTQFKLAEEYRRIQSEQEELGTPEATNRVFIETFGEGAVLAVVPNTKAADDRSPVPPNRQALEFFQDNKDAAERFPTVFGLFAPDEEGAKFDFVAYNRQLETGERVVVSPEEAIRRANQNVARMIYDQAEKVAEAAAPRNDFGKPKISKEQKAVLRELKGLLAEDYPGYSTSFSNDTPALLEDLKRAARDPQLGKTDAGKGLQIWLQARDAAEAGAQARFGVSWRTAGAAREIRDTMRALADELSSDFPGFANIYERVLEREMGDDDQMMAVAQ
jgi:hypothetical protein